MICTSYFAQINKIKNAFKDRKVHFINIARSKPNWIDGVIDFPDLFPEWSIVRAYKEGQITFKDYTDSYLKNTLGKLNSQEILEKLNRQKEQIDDVIILLCYEKATENCHRHLVREWLKGNIKEWQAEC